jgi:hypothetical protein
VLTLSGPLTPCYVRSVPLARSTLALVVVALALAGVACGPKSKTPAEAYHKFSEAVTAGDPGALWDALDQETRWAYMTVQKWHREAYDIVLSNYPEGPNRDRERRRFEHAATASSARALFISDLGPTVLPTLRPLAAPEATIQPGPDADHADAVLTSGQHVELARGKKGGWGFAGLQKRALDDKNRAFHDLELVRASAADYERAAARAGK